MDAFRRCWAEISLAALKNNLAQIRERIGPGVQILVPVKADAYGHGMEPVARAAVDGGAQWLGVANVAEAARVRRILPQTPVLILGASFSEEAGDVVRQNVSAVACTLDFIRHLDRAAGKQKTKARIHVKIDTGMGRIGVWHEEAIPFLEETRQFENVMLEGLCSHFPSAEEEKDPFTQEQIARFEAILKECRRRNIRVPMAHLANSSGILFYPASHLNLVRPGILIYGVAPGSQLQAPAPFQPLLTLKSRIIFIKETDAGRTISYGRTYQTPGKTRIATIPIGYGDGYARSLSNKGQVLIWGRRCPIVGRVTMDQIMVDVGLQSNVNVGDPVTLIGNDGDPKIRVEELAHWANTIPYEILTNLGDRIHRVYLS